MCSQRRWPRHSHFVMTLYETTHVSSGVDQTAWWLMNINEGGCWRVIVGPRRDADESMNVSWSLELVHRCSSLTGVTDDDQLFRLVSSSPPTPSTVVNHSSSTEVRRRERRHRPVVVLPRWRRTTRRSRLAHVRAITLPLPPARETARLLALPFPLCCVSFYEHLP